MKNILLLGGNGFIGKNIRESYLKDKYNIVSPSSKELNLLDQDSVINYFGDKDFDVVIYSVVKAGKLNTDNPNNIYFENNDVYTDNIRMFFNLVRNASGKFKKFINIGSGSCYNKGRNLNKVAESELYKLGNMPDDEHGSYKYMINKYIREHENMVDLILFGVFGKYEESMRFPTSTIKKCVNNEDIIINNDRVMDFLYIDDLMPVLEYFIDNNNEHTVYNVTPDESTSIVRLSKIIKEVANSRSNVLCNSCNNSEYSGSNKRLTEEIPNLKFTNIYEAIEDLYLHLVR